jgi:hypothetical protein
MRPQCFLEVALSFSLDKIYNITYIHTQAAACALAQESVPGEHCLGTITMLVTLINRIPECVKLKCLFWVFSERFFELAMAYKKRISYFNLFDIEMGRGPTNGVGTSRSTMTLSLQTPYKLLSRLASLLPGQHKPSTKRIVSDAHMRLENVLQRPAESLTRESDEPHNNTDFYESFSLALNPEGDMWCLIVAVGRRCAAETCPPGHPAQETNPTFRAPQPDAVSKDSSKKGISGCHGEKYSCRFVQ